MLTDNIASAGGQDMVQEQPDDEEELSTKEERDKQLVVTNWETSLPLRPSL